MGGGGEGSKQGRGIEVGRSTTVQGRARFGWLACWRVGGQAGSTHLVGLRLAAEAAGKVGAEHACRGRCVCVCVSTGGMVLARWDSRRRKVAKESEGVHGAGAGSA